MIHYIYISLSIFIILKSSDGIRRHFLDIFHDLYLIFGIKFPTRSGDRTFVMILPNSETMGFRSRF